MELQRRSTEAKAHNLFFALWPDAGVRDALAASAQRLKRDLASRGRWVAPHRYHITLHFLGRYDPSSPDRVARAVAAGDRVDTRAFELALDRVGSFPNRSIPWWIGCTMLPEGLLTLWESLGAGLHEAGIDIAGSESLVAHVTLLREAERRLPPMPIDPIAWPVRDFALIDSRLGSDARYTILRRWSLGA